MEIKTRRKLIKNFAELHKMTEPLCSHECLVPRSCCSPEYCNMAVDHAELYNVDLNNVNTCHITLRFMGPNGCVIAPHLRPLCTFHVCSINAIGKARSPNFDNDRYFELRNECEDLFVSFMESELDTI